VAVPLTTPLAVASPLLTGAALVPLTS